MFILDEFKLSHADVKVMQRLLTQAFCFVSVTGSFIPADSEKTAQNNTKTQFIIYSTACIYTQLYIILDIQHNYKTQL